MAAGHGKDAKLFVNGYELTAYLTSAGFDGSADVAEVSTLGDTAKEYIAGLKDGTLTIEGIFDGAASAVDEILNSIFGVDASVWCYLPQGDAVAKRGVGMSGIKTAYGVSSPVEDVTKFTATVQSSTGREGIIVHHAFATEAGAANGAAQDNGASSANGGAGYLQADGGGSAGASVWKVQHSTDSSVWADLITFATVTNNTRTKERKTVTGTVNRYTRATNDATTNGAKVLVGFGRL